VGWLLDVQGVTLQFGGNIVLSNVTMQIERGKIFGLIGPNGSGKTTLLNVISGVYHPTSGSVTLKGVETTELPPHAQELRCLARTFQIPRLWRRLSVLENVLVACYGKSPGRTGVEIMKDAREYISAFGLGQMLNERSSTLSGGQAKLLEVARAFACRPEIILLDEPFAGVAPSLIPIILERINNERDKGVSILIVSHVVSSLVDICDRLAAMSNGTIIAEGSPKDVLVKQSVMEAYLGGSFVTRS